MNDNKKSLYAVIIFLFIGFILRSVCWFYIGPQLLGDRNDYSHLSIYIVQGNWDAYFSDGRFYQPIYALLLISQDLFFI